ncbi:aminotransferase class I and II [Silvibacterium dinghuense]|uniref:Aminotransferase class I and II n=1 Tax=Silvibacterium dinghuense TaxID=1560006 RepID=A0A4Q1S917_9BACT|nr:aminotransferase class I and II [Silvibacterium dinghuense]
MRTVRATRYALALREGGSLPGLVEADDLGFYVVKFRGAGQGALALVAELVAGEIGRRLGLAVPELVFVDVDPVLGRNDPDAEIRHLLKASVGLNLGLDYLPGSIMFDRQAGDTASPEIASMAVWFDAFVQNVDRTARNPNLLVWHRTLHFIDQGAALYFHHNWQTAASKAESAFPEVAKHLLLPWASTIPEAAAQARSLLHADVLRDILARVPDAWIESEQRTAQERRNDYLDYLMRRLAASAHFEEEAIRSHDRLL